jgi:hypothetical protein
MRWLSAGLTFVNFTTVTGLIIGIIAGGLTPFCAAAAFTVGVFAAVTAYFRTLDTRETKDTLDAAGTHPQRYRDIWKWLIVACFAIFAVRSFCWLIYIDGNVLRIQSPNNLGDLALHVTYIKNFANGVPLWPDNPIYVGSKLRYPAGTDLFNSLLCLQDVDLIRGLIWAGLLGSIATFYAFYRWGGIFGVAGFLFNGGVVGFQFLRTWKFSDYQGVSSIAWKSIPLSMFVTQRGLLYAIPAGLLLLWHWREKFFRKAVAGVADPGQSATESTAVTDRGYSPLPFWVELSLYASMPLFHVHTFLALSAVLVCLGIFGDAAMRKDIGVLVGSAFVPATFFVWLITDHFHAGSVFALQPGWIQHDGDFAAPFFQFWLVNFGLWIPIILALIGICAANVRKSGWRWNQKLSENAAFLLPAVGIFLFSFFVKTAPWGWDNLKIMIWAYFLALPFLWTQLVANWPTIVRTVACIALFGSGFVGLIGGLAAGRSGFEFTPDRGELDGIGNAVRKLPATARFAAYPTYNHPLLLQGRKVVLGYPGHLWTEGFDYAKNNQRLEQLMNGAENWRNIAHGLQVQYIFWGREEKANYQSSKRPWEKTAALVNSGTWGAIYDVEAITNKHE